MLSTTLSAIRAKAPCEKGWKTLLGGLGGKKKQGLNKPLAYTRILEINGLNDCLWAISKTMDHPHKSTILRLFAVACAQEVLRLMEDQRSRDAVKAGHLFAHGEVDESALAAARAAAWDASRSARAAAWPAERDVARDASLAAAWPASRDADFESALAAAWDSAWAAAGLAVWDSAKAAVWERYSGWLRVILENYEEV